MKVISIESVRDFTRFKISPKLNGIFAKWTGDGFITKGGNMIMSVPHIKPDALPGTEGELYSHGMAFQDINRIVMQGFDKEKVVGWFPHNEIKSTRVESKEEYFAFYNKTLRQGYEGLVLTDIYTGEQWKHKPRHDTEAIVTGFTPGTGINESTFGSLILETEDGERFKCAGMTRSQRRRLWEDQPIGQLVTVSYQYLSKRGVPVHPSFVDYRHDMVVKHGGKRKGAGRKPVETKRDVRRMYRFTKEEYESILAAADAAGKKESDFVRDAVQFFMKGFVNG